MPDKIYLRSGLSTARPTLGAREPGFDSDTKDLYIGTTGGNVKVGVENPWGDGTSALRPFAGASMGGTPSITAATRTKLPFSTEFIDNLGNYDPALYRFTTPKTGAYLVSTLVFILSAVAGTVLELYVYKNGAEYRRLDFVTSTAGANSVGGVCPVPLAAGDYIEIYFQTSATLSLSGPDSKWETIRVS